MSIPLIVYLMKQDDPKKCTAAKLVRLRLARPIHSPRYIPPRAITLSPFSNDPLCPIDRVQARFGLVAVDCSWRKAEEVFPMKVGRVVRRLPLLVAANPVNYGHLGVLTSAEALAAGLFILGYKDQAAEVMSISKWGKTFLTLNSSILEDYALCADRRELEHVESEYFPDFSGTSVMYPR